MMDEDGWMDGWVMGAWRVRGGWDMGGWVEGGRTDGQKVGTRMTWFSRTSENIETGLAGDCVSVCVHGTRGSMRHRARLCGEGSVSSTPSSTDDDNTGTLGLEAALVRTAVTPSALGPALRPAEARPWSDRPGCGKKSQLSTLPLGRGRL